MGEIVTSAFGIKTGLILPHDNIREVTLEAVRDKVQDGDIVCVTEAVVARSQNRYVTCEELAEDIRMKLNLKPKAHLAIVFPIASRNRFALVLKAAALATCGGEVTVSFSLPYDEVGNQVIDPEFAWMRLRLKKILKSLQSARENTPHLNILIRETIAALVLQSSGYQVLGMRKIMGKGIADLTVRSPEGRLMPVEVTFSDLKKAASKAVELKGDMAEAGGALAVKVDLARREAVIIDAAAYLDDEASARNAAEVVHYAEMEAYFKDSEAIYLPEVGDAFFRHPITGVDYRALYLDMIRQGEATGTIIFSANPLKVYEQGYLDGVIIGEVHKRLETREVFNAFGADVPVVTLDEIGPAPWGVIGSNVSSEQPCRLKLLPEDASGTADAIREAILDGLGVNVEVIIFGDGAYKDPDSGIYELADPHPAIGVSAGLRSYRLRTGKKLKMHVDTLHQQGMSREEIEQALGGATPGKETEPASMSGSFPGSVPVSVPASVMDAPLPKEGVERKEEMREPIGGKREGRGQGEERSQRDQGEVGTTPRSLTSIVATLADLMAGSADAGTPIIVVRGFLRT
ncbi:MAG: coenzyme F420-0:L-glutamate ligase [Candidatus Carbobacillus altaicus]|nr:coenzyme F420-0:L-glutamate ligase [Candidatus Carbobacillus altaicus]